MSIPLSMRMIRSLDVFYWVFRMGLGLCLVWSSLAKLYASHDFLSAIYGYQLVSPQVGLFAAALIPWFELICGACLVLGIWQPGALLGSIALFGLFAVVIALAMARGLVTPCGCGGLAGESTVGWATLGRSLLFLLSCSIILVLPRSPSFTDRP